MSRSPVHSLRSYRFPRTAIGCLFGGAIAAVPRAAEGRPAVCLPIEPAPSRSAPALLAEACEVALARSAAPPAVSRDAAVYVLRASGYALVRASSNGHACLVERDHPRSLAPVCYDAEAVATILPGVLRVAELRAAGASYGDAKRQVDALYAGGSLTAPRTAAMAYMLSRDQVLYSDGDAPGSRRVGAWRPHVMIYSPGARPERTGAGPQNPAHPFVGDAGLPTAHLVVVVPEWSAAGPTRGAAGHRHH